MTRPAIVVIAWIDGNARTDDLAYWLEGRTRFMPWAWPGLPVLRRIASWCRSAVATWSEVRAMRGGTVVVVEPPVMAPLCAWAFRRKGTRLFVDLHSGALINPKWKWARPLLRFVARRSDGVVVTNTDTLAGFDLGAAPVYVLHDPVWARTENVEPARRDGPDASPYVLFPASDGRDEPLDLVERVGRILGGDPLIKVSGRVGRRSCAGVEYLGYLPGDEYRRLLGGASAVLSLTDWEATMQRSAYEAVHAGVPVVALGRKVLRDVYTGAGALFASADPEDLASTIRAAVADYPRLSAQTAEARARLRAGSDDVKRVLLGTA